MAWGLYDAKPTNQMTGEQSSRGGVFIYLTPVCHSYFIVVLMVMQVI